MRLALLPAVLIHGMGWVYAAAPAAWSMLRSPRFEIVTDCSSNRARLAFRTLEETWLAWAALEGRKPEDGPIRVFLFRDEGDFRRFVPRSTTRGLAQRGREWRYVLLADYAGMASTVRHEFVHAALQSSSSWPHWLEEGLADYYSTLAPGRGEALIGGNHPARVDELNRTSAPEPNILFAGPSAALPESTFYANSWALVTWLRQTDRFQKSLEAFLRARTTQTDEAGAFAIGFHFPARDALEQARTFAQTRRFTAARVPMGELPATPQAMPIREKESLLLLADLALALERAELFETYRSRLAVLETDAEVAASLGMLSLQIGERDRAERELRSAVAAGTRAAGAYFELATLLRDRHAPASEVTLLLEEAIRRNPGHAEAWFLLGKLRSGPQAAAALERAATLQPRRSPFWSELAEARRLAGRRDAAREAAEHALASAANSTEREVASGLLRMLEAPPLSQTAAPPRSDAVQPPAAETRQVKGRLVLVDCSGDGIRFHVQAGERTWVFQAGSTGSVMLAGGTREFACGAQGATPVTIEYRPAQAPGAKNDGDIVAVRF